MKKIIALILVLMCCFAFIACSNTSDEQPKGDGENVSETTGDQAEDKTEQGAKWIMSEGVNPDDYFVFVKFEDHLEGDFRDIVTDYMLKQASIEWTPGTTFSYGNEYEHWQFKLVYEKGKTYHGLPYTNLSCSIGEFQKFLDEHDGTFTATSTDGYSVMGAHCNSSICHSFQQVTPVVCMTSDQYMPAYKDDFVGKILGNYVVPEGIKRTVDIMHANKPDTIYEAYALADRGDVIMSKDDERGVTHDRMVSAKAYVERNNSGKINPNRSYLTTREQTDTFDATRKDGVNTTWWIDHTYTFSELYTSNYIPVTFELFEEQVGIIPFIALDKEITASMIEKGVINGTVSSNYPLRYCHMSIYDSSEKLVRRELQQNNYDDSKVGLRKFSVNLLKDLPAGEYTFVLEAGVCRGDAELCRVSFTVKE